jgi:double-stranded RNA-specific adenosine deaminase
MRAVRSAEADRLSSCKFADAVALAAINKYREACSDELRRSYKQTVLAAFVLQVPKYAPPAASLDLSHGVAESGGRGAMALEVVSLGVGTKFLNAQQLLAYGSLPMGAAFLKDMHAEVLAKRGFQRFLLQECLVAIKSITDGTVRSSYIECIDVLTMELRFREGITVHLYSSSQPCGNASIKRWAKGKVPTQYPELSEQEYPLEVHPILHLTAVHEGQVLPLAKGCITAGIVGLESKGGDVLTDSLIADIEAKALKIEHLPGTYPACLWPLRTGIMSCSDKIAKWNALGVQGSLLSGVLSRPIYLSTCVVGRKYSHAHLCRALCCRVSGFTYPCDSFNPTSKRRKRRGSELSNDLKNSTSTSASLFFTHHPSMLSTSVKFDDGAITTAPVLCTELGATELSDFTGKAVVGADFGELRCFVFVQGNEQCSGISDVIDSRSGAVCSKDTHDAFGGESPEVQYSEVSGLALHALSNRVQDAIRLTARDGAVDAMMQSKRMMYESAKTELFNNTIFQDWIQ